MRNSRIINKTLYYRSINDNLNLDFSPSIIGYEVCNKNKSINTCNKSCYIIHFITTGSGFIELENKKIFELKEGDCFISDPYSNIKYYPNQTDPWSYIWIEVTGAVAKKISNLIDIANINYHLHLTEFDQIFKIFEKIFDECAILINNDAETMRVSGELYQVFSKILLELNIRNNDKSISCKENNIKRVVEYINNNYTSSDISIKKIADNFFFNQAYLTRTFKNYTGVSPIKYIITLRMRRALELLEKKTFSISQIAFALGYKNQFYFSKEFRRYYGIQPSKYFDHH